MHRTSIVTALCLTIISGCSVIKDDLLNGTRDATGGDDDDDDIDGSPTDAAFDAPIDAPIVITPNLLVDYQFEDTAAAVTDLSGHDHHATLSDVSAWTSAGRNGRGLALTGTQYVSLPNGILTDVGDFTVTVWVRVSVNTAWARLYDIGNGLPDPAGRFMFLTILGFNSAASPVGLHSTSYGGSAANEVMLSANALLPTGVWKHVALTGATGQRRLYVDGYPVGEIADAPNVPPREMEPIAPMSWIGRSRFASDPGLSGSLDEFRIYNRVLTTAEIQDLAWPKTDYSYWRFDETGGAVAVDSSDGAISTALTAGVTWTQGRIGGALDLPGGAAGAAGPHATLSTSPLAGCTNQLTISSWIRLRALTADSRLFDFGTGATTSISLAPTDGTGMRLAMASAAGMFELTTAAPPIPGDNTWHHVAVAVDTANVATIYIDGLPVAQRASTTVRPSDFAATTENWIGRSRGTGLALNGSVDDLRISCRAFTADEMKMLAHR